MVINIPTFSSSGGLCARVVNSHTVIALAASPSVERNLMSFILKVGEIVREYCGSHAACRPRNGRTTKLSVADCG